MSSIIHPRLLAVFPFRLGSCSRDVVISGGRARCSVAAVLGVKCRGYPWTIVENQFSSCWKHCSRPVTATTSETAALSTTTAAVTSTMSGTTTSSNHTATEQLDLTTLDPTQVQLLSEQCILVDPHDRVIGSDTKMNCHLMSNINNPNPNPNPNPHPNSNPNHSGSDRSHGMLHRAFSVFMFDDQDRLLLQQRSDEKITFPGQWTNSCCSHPLYRDDELLGVAGVRRAAQRRIAYELGVAPEHVPATAGRMRYVTRIHYKAASGGGRWGEHEIDYVIFIRDAAGDNVTPLNVNPNEVKAHKYVTRDELREMLRPGGDVPVTPWFKLICDTKLFTWWEHLDDMEKYEDHETIHRL